MADELKIQSSDFIDSDGIKQQETPESDMDFVEFKKLMRNEWDANKNVKKYYWFFLLPIIITLIFVLIKIIIFIINFHNLIKCYSIYNFFNRPTPWINPP